MPYTRNITIDEFVFFITMMFINGKPVSPIQSVLTLALIVGGLAVMVFFLLPVIGTLLVVFALAVVGLILYGMYYKWRYGDPVKKMQEELARKMASQMNPQAYASEQTRQEATKTDTRSSQTRTGVKRTTTIEDAVIVEEVTRR